jgi:hypothetical protein
MRSTIRAISKLDRLRSSCNSKLAAHVIAKGSRGTAAAGDATCGRIDPQRKNIGFRVLRLLQHFLQRRHLRPTGLLVDPRPWQDPLAA